MNILQSYCRASDRLENRMAMLYGIVFLGHQIGSFIGVWLGGWLYDRSGSYDLVWWLGVVLGLMAAFVHWLMSERPVARLAIDGN